VQTVCACLVCQLVQLINMQVHMVFCICHQTVRCIYLHSCDCDIKHFVGCIATRKLMWHVRWQSAHLEVHHLGNALVSILLVIPDFMYLHTECSRLLIVSDSQAFLSPYADCSSPGNCKCNKIEACKA